jgi:hypothetical protein
MYIKKGFLIGAIVVVVLLMIAEARFVAFMAKAQAIHQYHGLCNYGVGRPYAKFVHQLRLLCESGDTTTLTRTLRSADEQSRIIYEVWLADQQEAYQKSIHQILK